MMPVRLQLSRAKGYRKPAGAVVVSRPTKWGNPIAIKPMPMLAGYRGNGRRIEEANRRFQVVEMFRGLLLKGEAEPYATMLRDIGELRGKDLACWCKLTEKCHGDVLLEVANRG
jgi:Domain of unknown function (DUF4326)